MTNPVERLISALADRHRIKRELGAGGMAVSPQPTANGDRGVLFGARYPMTDSVNRLKAALADRYEIRQQPSAGSDSQGSFGSRDPMSDSVGRLTGALADRYQILPELGGGEMATVYLAEDIKHKRKVALKVLRPELAAVIGAERFLAEIETTANLQHPQRAGTDEGGVLRECRDAAAPSARRRDAAGDVGHPGDGLWARMRSCGLARW